jgi:acetyl esterase/lipase
MLYEKIRDYFFTKMTNAWAKHDKMVLSKQTIPQGIIEKTDIPYNDVLNLEQTLDIYYPVDAQGPLPVVINIHGGGFIYGDKKINKLYCYHLAKKGFLIINLNYRLAKKEVKVVDQIQDIISAMDWTGKNIDTYPADKNKIYLTGESAGAYLAVMAVLVSKSERLQKLFNMSKPDLDIKSIGITCGFMDWTRKGIFYSALKSKVLDKGYKNRQYYKNLILKNIPEITSLPPVFLSSNGDDMLKDMTFSFVELLKMNNIKHNLLYFDKNNQKYLGHVFNIFHFDREETHKVNDSMLEFFLNY